MRITFPSGVKWITQSNSNGQPNNYLNINDLKLQDESILTKPQNAGQDKKNISLQYFTFFYIF